MKKRFSMLLAVAMVMSLVACNGSKTAETTAEAVQAENGSESSEAADGDGEAQELWAPEKTVDFIVPFNAGGSSDLLARVFANQGSSYFDTEFVIINEGGGSCSIGLTDLMDAIKENPNSLVSGACSAGSNTHMIVSY